MRWSKQIYCFLDVFTTIIDDRKILWDFDEMVKATFTFVQMFLPQLSTIEKSCGILMRWSRQHLLFFLDVLTTIIDDRKILWDFDEMVKATFTF